MTNVFKAASFHSSKPALAPRDFEAFQRFLERECGIFLSANKQYLVETRIGRILTEHNLASLGELVTLLQQPHQISLRTQVVDAMTTNETFWFRDGYPYLLMERDLLPQLMSGVAHTGIRIWSAACASGQEPYSLSMVLEEYRRKSGNRLNRKIEILGTDLSSRVLEQARRAEYDRSSIMRGLQAHQVSEYFQELADAGCWRLRDHLRSYVTFRAFNLLDSYGPLGKFDIIFCRNVLIYFNAGLKEDILRRLHGALNPGGILFLGASEGVANASDLYEMVHANPGIYYRAR